MQPSIPLGPWERRAFVHQDWYPKILFDHPKSKGGLSQNKLPPVAANNFLMGFNLVEDTYSPDTLSPGAGTL